MLVTPQFVTLAETVLKARGVTAHAMLALPENPEQATPGRLLELARMVVHELELRLTRSHEA